MTQKERIQVKWQGSALENKLIDVRDLAPSLIALGELCVAANEVLNGDKSQIKVMISAEPEQSSFVIDVYFHLEVYNAAKNLFSLGEGITNLKEILEWLDLLSPYAKGAIGVAGGGGGLFGLYKMLKGKKVQRVLSDSTKNPNEDITISVENNGSIGNLTINPTVYKLAANKNVVRSLHKFLEPINRDNGVDSVSFLSDGGDMHKVNQYDIDMESLSNPLRVEPEDPNDDLTINIIEKWCKLISPVFDENADKWRFAISGSRHYIDISDTKIVSNAEGRGQVGFQDMYKLRLQETETIKVSGKSKIAYKAIEVLDFKKTPRQDILL